MELGKIGMKKKSEKSNPPFAVCKAVVLKFKEM